MIKYSKEVPPGPYIYLKCVRIQYHDVLFISLSLHICCVSIILERILLYKKKKLMNIKINVFAQLKKG